MSRLQRGLRLAAVVLGLAGGAVLAGVAGAAPGQAPELVLTGVHSTPGAVEFFVAGRRLPAGGSLSAADVAVAVDDTTLASTARQVSGPAGGAPGTAVVLVLDTSGSMAGARLAAARTAAADYAAAAPAGVLLGVVTVADRPSVLLRPTADRAAFAGAVSRLVASGSTGLYDGISTAVGVLTERTPGAPEPAERRVVVLSDGADTASALQPDELRRGLSRADVVLDAVAFGAAADAAQLSALTGATGGRTVPAADAADLRAVFRTMAGELSPPVVVRAVVPPALSGRAVTLRVRATVAGTELVATTALQLVADAAAQSARAPVVVPAAGRGPFVMALALLAAGLFLVAALVLHPVLGRSPLDRRLRELDNFTVGRRVTGITGPPAAGGAVLRAALTVSERAVRAPDQRARIELALDRAGSSLRAAEWLLIRAGVSVGAAVLLALLLPWWCGVPVGLLAGWLGSAQYLRMRASRRTRAFADQLPDALQLVVGSLRSGFSLPQAVDALVREGADPVAGELGRALAETRLGGDLQDALERVGERNASQDMQWLVMAIRIQREVGGNLSEVLETAVATMRERGRLARHVRALSAEGRLSALILLGMPIVLAAWMFVFRREYLRPLYTEPMGLAMLIGSVVLVAIGGLWLRKLVQVVV